MKIIDNFVEAEHFKKMSDFMLSPGFDWHISNNGVTKQGDGHFQFGHFFYNSGIPAERYGMVQDIMWKILDADSLNCEHDFCILRIKSNLLTKTEQHVVHGMHEDFQNFRQEYKTAILYMNTNNGYTLFKNGERVDSVANRVVIFDGKEKHSSVSQTDTNVRCVINFNWVR